jgi:hypothetical protein
MKMRTSVPESGKRRKTTILLPGQWVLEENALEMALLRLTWPTPSTGAMSGAKAA